MGHDGTHGAVEAREGERVDGDALHRWIGTVAADLVPAGASLQNRLKMLISLRNEEGYMAEVHRQSDGSFFMIENHCPICAAANVCSMLCDSELDIFRAILGEGVVIERTEHMLAGARRCVYRIRPAEEKKKKCRAL